GAGPWGRILKISSIEPNPPARSLVHKMRKIAESLGGCAVKRMSGFRLLMIMTCNSEPAALLRTPRTGPGPTSSYRPAIGREGSREKMQKRTLKKISVGV